MGTNSIEWNAEELLMRSVVRDSRLTTVPMRHWERLDQAILDALIFRATKEDCMLDGVKGYATTVEVTYLSGIKTPDEVDAIAAALSQAAYNTTPFDPDLPDIYFASLEPETKTTRSDNTKTRKRVVSFPFILALNADPLPPSDEMSKTSTDTPDELVESFTVTWPQPFTGVPRYADARLNPPDGQPAIGINDIKRFTDRLEITFDVALPAAGYELNSYALL